jgi:membrane protein DedA with SNARE-associated domain
MPATSFFLSEALKYAAVFITTPIGGPPFVLATGFLLENGYLQFIPLLFTVAAAELAIDTLWYGIGRKYAARFIASYGKYFSVTAELFDKAKGLFERYDAYILLISKITMGFGLVIPILLTAGASRVSFIKYLLLNALGEIILVATLLSLGYYLGSLTQYVAQGFRIAFIAGTIALFTALFFGVSRYLRKKQIT